MINRQGVDVYSIGVGDTIVYQCGEGTSPKLTTVTAVRESGTVETVNGTIAKDYVLGIVPKYKAPQPKPIDDKWEVSERRLTANRNIVTIQPIGLAVRVREAHIYDNTNSLKIAQRIVDDHNLLLRVKEAYTD